MRDIGVTYTISATKYDWKCQIIEDHLVWHVEEGKQPNAFHRLMQRLFFGIKWSKIND
jgi:hypothetical protein